MSINCVSVCSSEIINRESRKIVAVKEKTVRFKLRRRTCTTRLPKKLANKLRKASCVRIDCIMFPIALGVQLFLVDPEKGLSDELS